jgi:hypothetical protein
MHFLTWGMRHKVEVSPVPNATISLRGQLGIVGRNHRTGVIDERDERSAVGRVRLIEITAVTQAGGGGSNPVADHTQSREWSLNCTR